MLSKLKNEASLFLLLLAFWPVWQWYVARMLDPSDESWGVIALITAIFFVLTRQKTLPSNSNLLPCLCFLMLYISIYHFVLPIISACVAMLALALFMSQRYYGKWLQPGIMGLMVISLPLISSFQFYLGYPLRLVASHLCLPFLSLAGFNAYVEGVVIHCNNTMIVVDAPCTGIRMGWVAFYLCYFLATYYNFNLKKTLLCMSTTSFCVLVANVLRACSLVHMECGSFNFPAYMHDVIGIMSFTCLAVALCLIAAKLNKKEDACLKLSS